MVSSRKVSSKNTYKSCSTGTGVEEVSQETKRSPKQANRGPTGNRGARKSSRPIMNLDRSQKRQAHTKYSDWFKKTDDEEVLTVRRILVSICSPKLNCIASGKYTKNVLNTIIDKLPKLAHYKLFEREKTVGGGRKPPSRTEWINTMYRMVQISAENTRHRNNIRYLKEVKKCKHGVYPEKYNFNTLGLRYNNPRMNKNLRQNIKKIIDTAIGKDIYNARKNQFKCNKELLKEWSKLLKRGYKEEVIENTEKILQAVNIKVSTVKYERHKEKYDKFNKKPFDKEVKIPFGKENLSVNITKSMLNQVYEVEFEEYVNPPYPYIREQKEEASEWSEIQITIKKRSGNINKKIKNVTIKLKQRTDILGIIPENKEELEGLVGRMGPNYKFPPKIKNKEQKYEEDMQTIGHAVEVIRVKYNIEKNEERKRSETTQNYHETENMATQESQSEIILNISQIENDRVNEGEKALRNPPFHNNTRGLMKKGDDEIETKICQIRDVFIQKQNEEMEKLEKSDTNKLAMKTQKAMKEIIEYNKLMMIPSDKTKRLCLVNEDTYIKKCEETLNTKHYMKVKEWKKDKICNKANKIVEEIAKENPNIEKTVKRRLITDKDKAIPSKFRGLIKDHKKKDENGEYPIRPVASVKGTPIEKVDWILSEILNQGLSKVKAHIRDGDDIIEEINKVETGKTIFSLDVEALYPSVPIHKGITAVTRLLLNNRDIETYGISIQKIREMLRLVADNYYIQFNGQIYRQTKGLPMGAHYSPVVAIIYLDEIEKKALRKVKEEMGIEPIIYRRYVDDVLMVFDKEVNEARIKEIFCSIENDIQFTLDLPKEGWLPFLDTQMSIDKGKIDYKWYQKEFHSGNLVHYQSFVTDKVKENFIITRIHNIAKKSKKVEYFKEGVEEITQQLFKNAYPLNEIYKQIRRYARNYGKQRENKFLEENKDKILVKTTLYNTKGLKELDQEAEKIGLPMKFIPAKREPIFNEYGSKKIKKYIQCIGGKNCEICRQTGKEGTCMKYYIIYVLSCKKCIEEIEKYIGGTNRALYRRIGEHEEAIKKLNKNASAIAQHLIEKHQLDKEVLEEIKKNNMNVIKEFLGIEIATQMKHPIDTWIMEAEYINQNDPKINRKNEKYMMWVDKIPKNREEQ